MTGTDDAPRKIPPGVQVNFALLKQMIRKGNAALVICTDPQGNRYNVVCSLAAAHTEDGEQKWQYSPFAIMVGDSVRPLLDSLTPPKNLKGTWRWPPQQFQGIYP